MQDITCRYEYENVMRDIPTYNRKNMELADLLLQIEKVALLTHSQEYELPAAKSRSTPYKMLKRLCNNTDWQDIKRKLEYIYSPIATEVHAASDLHWKQRPDEALQENIQNFTDFTTKILGIDSTNITNHVIIFLFIQN